jgi:hypothetical protein
VIRSFRPRVIAECAPAAVRLARGTFFALVRRMAGKRVVLGIVDSPFHADLTVQSLLSRGFPGSAIAVLYPDRHGAHDFGFDASTKAPEGALAGIGLGAILGAIAGLVLGLHGYVQPGGGAALVPTLTALAGAAAGALPLGIAGALAGARMPEIEAKPYDGKMRIGSILVGVTADLPERVRVARAVLRSVAATNVHATTEAVRPLSST